VSKKSIRPANRWNGSNRRWSISAVLALLITGLTPTVGNAYTAAGDRNFPANLILPQVTSTDAFWTNFSAQPQASGPGDQLQFTGTFSKLITERLGIQFSDGLTRESNPSNFWGGQNFAVLLQYEAILDPPHEFLMSVQVEQEFGGTGNQRIVSSQSATQPAVTFAKGLGDLPIGYWRPLAITGFAGYQVAQASSASNVTPRSNVVNAGFSIEYSIPYLVSKVANVDPPAFLRGMTPITEVLYSNPVGRRHQHNTTLQVAPGISYSQGRGWELGIEALIPTTHATGTGLGVFAQLVVQLDYLLPDSFFGQPIFPLHEPR
jgi:hypothetical protein